MILKRRQMQLNVVTKSTRKGLARMGTARLGGAGLGPARHGFIL